MGFRSSIVAGNTATTDSPDVNRPQDSMIVTSQGNNLIGDPTGAPGFDGLGDQVGTPANPLDPRLGPLANNGGPTLTHALLPDSPAINRGSNFTGLTTDQRGAGFPRTHGPSPDVGAFEAVYPPPWAGVTAPSVTVGGGTSYTFTVTYRDDVAVNVATLGNGDLVVTGPGGFSAPASFVGVDNPTNGTPRVATYRFTPPGGFWNAADNGIHRITAQPNQVADTDGNFLPAGVIASVSVNIPLPSASARLSNLTTPGAAAYTFTVTYADDFAVDVQTLGTGDIRVNGPNGFSALADFVGVNTNTNGTPRVATYRVLPPGGSWDGTDIGTYTVSVEANQVADLSGDFVSSGSLDTFRVILPATLTVTSAADSGPGSLRDALARANANAPATDTIVFDPAVFSAPQTITLASGPLTITDSTTIQGPGADRLTISGNDATRVFVADGPGRLDVTLAGLTLTHGRMTGTNSANVGGAVYVADENLTVSDCAFTANAADAGGGAVGAGGVGGTLVFRRSTFDGNTAQNQGGAVSVPGAFSSTTTAVTLDGCTVVNNSVTGTSVVYGGGVYTGPKVSLTVVNCSITDNTSNGAGGGLAVSDNLTLRDGTVSRNRAAYDGGGVWGGVSAIVERSTIDANTAGLNGGGVGGVNALTLIGSTVSNNVAQTGTGGVAVRTGTIRNSTISGNTALSTSVFSAGGVAFVTDFGAVVVENSTITANSGQGAGGIVISRNSAGTPVTANITSTIVTGNSVRGFTNDIHSNVPVVLVRSVVGPANPSYFSAASHDNLPFGTDVRLGPLADNGGPSRTHALLAGSPAIDAGSNPSGVIFDQRAPLFPRVSDAAPDIGAYEVVGPIPSAAAVCPDVTTPTRNAYTFTVYYFDDAGIRVSSLGTGDVRVTGPRGFSVLAELVGVDVNADGSPRAATYRFVPPGGAWDLTNSGGYLVSVEPNQVTDTSGNGVPAGPIGEVRVYFPNIANTFEVHTTADDGPGSLRKAVQLANLAFGSADQIVFDPAVFATARTITLTTGPIVVTESVRILGAGRDRLTVSGNNSSRILNIEAGALEVSLSGLTLTGGNANHPIVPEDGGAILDRFADLTVSDCAFVGNAAFGGGGAIRVGQGGSLTVISSTFANNSAQSGAGAIEAVGPLTIIGSTFVGNTGEYGGAAAILPGTSLPPNTYPLTVLDSLFVGNTAATPSGGNGGALSVASSDAVIRNSTFSGNRAVRGTSTNGEGGAISFGYYGRLTVENCTFTGNSADVAGGAITASPSPGLATTPLTTITSSIVSDNSAPTGPDIAGPTQSVSAAHQIRLLNSALGSAGGFLLAPDSANNLPFGTDIRLGPLADNGGPAGTHALLAGSPAIDAGANPAGLLNDQRGFGFARTTGAGTDIGAYEYVAVGIPVATAGPLPDVTRRGATAYDFNVTFRDDVAISVASLGTGDVRVTGPSGFSALPVFLGADLNGDGTPRTVTYRLTPSGGFWDAADSGDYAVDLLANQVADTAGNFVPALRLGQFSAAPPAAVVEVRVNDGSAQRSRVTSLTVMFDGAIQFLRAPADTFRVRRSDGTDVGVVAALGVISGRYAVTLTFTGAGLEGGSLPDGDYALTVFGATARTGPTGPLLDADGDGLPGGDLTFLFHRLYGDVNGDKAVNGLDLALFRGAFGTTFGSPNYADYLDQNGDGAINGLDLAAYRSRFGTILP